MSFSWPGRRPKVGKVSKIRRTQAQAYGDRSSWDAMCDAVKQRDGYRCRDCGKHRSQVRKLEVHHIIPVSRGGRTVMYNLKTLCDECHDKQPFHNHLAKASARGYRR